MRHTDLSNIHARKTQTNEQLCGEECPIRVHADAAQCVSAKEFRRAIYVANTESEPDPIRNPIQSCVDQAQWWVGALQPVSNNHWRPCCLSAVNKSYKVGDAELTISVGVGKMPITRLRKT